MERSEQAPQSIDQILSSFDIAKSNRRTRDPKDTAPITLWVPIEVKEKYDSIQAKSHKKFCRTLTEIVKAAIDRINVDSVSP